MLREVARTRLDRLLDPTLLVADELSSSLGVVASHPPPPSTLT
jgi:hypothetical protein